MELKLVMFAPDKPPGNTWVRQFARRVEELSGGQLKINIIGGPEAIPADEAPAAAQRGVVDIAECLGYSLQKLVPGFDSVHLAERTVADLRQLGLTAFLQEQFAPRGLYLLGACRPSEPQVTQFLGLRQRISKLQDFKGLKIATDGAAAAAFVKELGATPVAIPLTEYFTAVERGVVDGYACGLTAVIDFGLGPVTEFVLEEPIFSSGGMAYIVNLETWDKLPQSLQEVLTQAAIEHEKNTQIWDDIVSQGKAELAKQGVQFGTLPPEEALAFYQLFRKTTMEQDLQIGNREIVSKIHEFILNPDFYRLKLDYYQKRQ
jgi:TRAP-type C4-dicarboxylate transport system substrate-binding protein